MCILACVHVQAHMWHWGSGRLQLHDGEDIMLGKGRVHHFVYFLDGLTWRHFVTDPRNMSGDDSHRMIATANSKWINQGVQRKYWQYLNPKSSVLSQCLSQPCIRSSKKDTKAHSKVKWTLHLVPNQIHLCRQMKAVNLQFTDSLMFPFRNPHANNSRLVGQLLFCLFVLFIFPCACFNVWGCQAGDGDWAQGYPWASRDKKYTFISYSSEWLFSAGGSWRYLPKCPPFLFDLAHLSSAVAGSLLELPPQ